MAAPSSAPGARLTAGLLVLLSTLLLIGTGQARATTIQDACAAAGLGEARCDAQVLVAGRQPVRPNVTKVSTGARAHSLGGLLNSAVLPEPAAGTPLYLQQAYDLTSLAAGGGASETVAVVDAYGDPSAASDLSTFRAEFGLTPCTTASGCLRVINQDGAATPLPEPSQSWSAEQSLDLDAVSALCPNCRIVLVQANDAGIEDMQQAIDAAVAAGADIVSNSWSEESPASPFTSDLSFPGVSLVASSGDDGTLPTGENDYPAALPTVTAVGGTDLSQATGGGQPRGFAETAWSDGGSGCDTYEQAPSWQPQTGCDGRAYSDVSADADPNDGLDVYDSQAGGWLEMGGTSLAAPLVAAFEAITAINGSSPQWAYSDESALNPVTTGSNGSCLITVICNAGPGWNGPTGAGSISGAVTQGAPGIGGPDVSAGSIDTYTQSVSSSGAMLLAGLYPNGERTTYHWQYGTTAAYGSQTAATTIPAGAAPVSVQGALASLAPSTTYHYRLVATNASGTSYGYDFTLTTDPAAQSEAKPTTSGTRTRKPPHKRRRPHKRRHHTKHREHRRALLSG